MPDDLILNSDCLTALRTMPDECVNMCICSPPYWALRNYNVEGQLGLEKTPEEYIDKLCDIFDEVRRVLRKDGSCWINIGDTYSSQRWFDDNNGQAMNNHKDTHRNVIPEKKSGLPPKCLVNIPFRLAIEMTKRGWIQRNTIIWHKPSCMPSSVKDRFTIDFEYLFFFTKSTKYYFNTQYEPLAEATKVRAKYGCNRNKTVCAVGTMTGDRFTDSYKRSVESGKRIKRCVWAINPARSKEKHFATYPEKLIETPIAAGCPEFVCVKCGKPRIEIKEKINNISQTDRVLYKETKKCGERLDEVNTAPRTDQVEHYRVVGMTDCGCGMGFRPGIVLDPFFGSGTSGLVAKKQNKHYIGIELNPEYCQIAEKRLSSV